MLKRPGSVLVYWVLVSLENRIPSAIQSVAAASVELFVRMIGMPMQVVSMLRPIDALGCRHSKRETQISDDP